MCEVLEYSQIQQRTFKYCKSELREEGGGTKTNLATVKSYNNRMPWRVLYACVMNCVRLLGNSIQQQLSKSRFNRNIYD